MKHAIVSESATAVLPSTLYTAEQVRELDRVAIREQGVPGAVLMKRAGRALLATLLDTWPQPAHIHVFCGSGNNAGDGYILAGLAAEKQLAVQVWQVGDPAKLAGDARRAYDFAQQAGVPMAAFTPATSLSSGVIVDALLGTGTRGAVRPAYAAAIAAINDSGLPVLAADIPSGLSADTGEVLGCVVTAAVTATFIGLKRGLFTGQGVAHVGRLVFDDLAVPPAIYQQVPSDCSRLTLSATLQALAPRSAHAHKGDFGHVLVVGGDHGFAGATLLAAEAAARTGAGLVSVATRAQHLAALVARRPELMVRGVETAADLQPLLAKATVVVVGPGLGQSSWGQELLEAVLQSSLPLVVDADALNRLAATPTKPRDNWLLTPHPGEAARLLDSDAATVNRDRFAAVAQLAERYGGVALLKGAGTLIAGPSVRSGAEYPQDLSIALSQWGNPGMASGGMGDVLSGVLGGLMAQGLSPRRAAELGVVVHGLAGDAAAEAGQRGLLAADLMPEIRRLLDVDTE